MYRSKIRKAVDIDPIFQYPTMKIYDSVSKFARQNCVHRANYGRHYRASDHLLRLVAVSSVERTISSASPPPSPLHGGVLGLTRAGRDECLKTNWHGRTSGRKRVSIRDFTVVLTWILVDRIVVWWVRANCYGHRARGVIKSPGIRSFLE